MDVRESYLKLILSVDALSPSLSGIGRYTWELAKGLKSDATIKQVKFYRAESWINDPAILLLDSAAQAKNKRRLKYPRWAKDLYWQQAFRGHIFHAPNYFLPTFAENGVITVHDLSVFKFPKTHPVERVRHFEREFTKSVMQARHVITDSITTRDEVILFTGLPKTQVTAVPLGVSASYKPRSAQETLPTLSKYNLNYGSYGLCVSTLEPRKKIKNLLMAWQQLPVKLRSAFPLILIGGFGWLCESLKTEIELGEAKGWVKHLGFVPESDLPLIYAGAKLFVYPSSYEGFGLPPIEAMAAGVPVVVSNQSCLPEVTQGAALMVNPEDVACFTLAIQQGLTDTCWREKSISNGLTVASKYTWKRCVDETASIYRQINMSKN
jgi:alpha-1,3-rhamnosyl/mannosyltransferase